MQPCNTARLCTKVKFQDQNITLEHTLSFVMNIITIVQIKLKIQMSSLAAKYENSIAT